MESWHSAELFCKTQKQCLPVLQNRRQIQNLDVPITTFTFYFGLRQVNSFNINQSSFYKNKRLHVVLTTFQLICLSGCNNVGIWLDKKTNFIGQTCPISITHPVSPHTGADMENYLSIPTKFNGFLYIIQ